MRNFNLIRNSINCLFAFAISSAAVFAQTAPLIAPVRNAIDDYHGTQIIDPYR